MQVFFSKSTDIYFHLALEEYLLNETSDNYLFFWISENAVVCGKHQNLCAEIDYAFCTKNNIQIARRLSGGGTVFHDLGNINFSFIENVNRELEKAIDYKLYLDKIKFTLEKLGIFCTYSERNDLLLNKKKISGNAQHLNQQKKRILHHGTLLYDSNLANVRNSLHTRGNYESKAVTSVKSIVTNIKSEIEINYTTQEFIDILIQEICVEFNYVKIPEIIPTQIEFLHLFKSKYSTKKWILDYSPKYVHTRKMPTNIGVLEFHLDIHEGIIIAAIVKLNNEHITEIETKLLGNLLREESIELALGSFFENKKNIVLEFF